MGARLFSITIFSVMLAHLASASEFSPQAPIQAPTSKAAFCSMHKTYGFVRAQFFNTDNKLSFDNPPGYLDTGLCWWHSRMQRAAIYLADFRPLEKKPSNFHAYMIIDNIFRLRKVEVIPGYSNFQSFSKDFEALLIRYLSNIQFEETAYFEFVRGLRFGNVTAAFIKRQAERLYKRVAIDDKVQFVLTKNSWVWYESHSWLVVGATKNGEKYEFYYIDSEHSPQVAPSKFEYTPGDSKLNYRAAYLQHDTDFWFIDSAVNQYCR